MRVKLKVIIIGTITVLLIGIVGTVGFQVYQQESQYTTEMKQLEDEVTNTITAFLIDFNKAKPEESVTLTGESIKDFNNHWVYIANRWLNYNEYDEDLYNNAREYNKNVNKYNETLSTTRIGSLRQLFGAEPKEWVVLEYFHTHTDEGQHEPLDNYVEPKNEDPHIHVPEPIEEYESIMERVK